MFASLSFISTAVKSLGNYLARSAFSHLSDKSEGQMQRRVANLT